MRRITRIQLRKNKVQGAIPFTVLLLVGLLVTLAFFGARSHWHLVGLATQEEELWGEAAWVLLSLLLVLSSFTLGALYGPRVNAKGYLVGGSIGTAVTILARQLGAASLFFQTGVLASWFAGLLIRKHPKVQGLGAFLGMMALAWILSGSYLVLFLE